MVFPCPSPCAEQAEKARGLATPCRVTFERRTPRRFFIKLRSHDGPAEKPAKAQKLVCSRFKDFFYIGCMVILYGGNSCSGQPYVDRLENLSGYYYYYKNNFINYLLYYYPVVLENLSSYYNTVLIYIFYFIKLLLRSITYGGTWYVVHTRYSMCAA